MLSVSLLAATVAGSAWAVTAFVSLFTGVVKKVGSLHVDLSPSHWLSESQTLHPHGVMCLDEPSAEREGMGQHIILGAVTECTAITSPMLCYA